MAEPVQCISVTADTAQFTGRGWYWGCRLTGDGTNPPSVIVRDNPAAAGTVIDNLRCGATETVGEMFPNPVRLYEGLHIDVTTVGRVTVWFQDET